MSAANNAASPLNDKPMTWQQIVVVAITVMLNALDGFDVLSISFAAPGIAEDWGIDRGALGIVLSMELIGMAIGSVTLGRLGDRLGRKPTMLICLGFMTVGMFLASSAQDITTLSLYRILTGLGIGGMLAVTNAVASEVSNKKSRNLAISIMVIGYPVGAVLGGMVVAQLLQSNSWPIIFQFGGIVTAIMIPIVLIFVPETPNFIISKKGEGALERLNRSLVRLGHVAMSALPEAEKTDKKGDLAGLFRGAVGRTTILLTIAYFFHIITFYFVIKWAPKIVSDFGYTQSAAATVLVWANIGGAIGGICWGFASSRFDIKRTAMMILAISAVGVAGFGYFGKDLSSLTILAAVSGFFTNAAIAALYNLAAVGFPDHYRATGTGFVIGIGRGGAVLGPMMVGALFAGGFTLPTVAAIMGVGSLGALLAVGAMHLQVGAAKSG